MPHSRNTSTASNTSSRPTTCYPTASIITSSISRTSRATTTGDGSTMPSAVPTRAERARGVGTRHRSSITISSVNTDLPPASTSVSASLVPSRPRARRIQCTSDGDIFTSTSERFQDPRSQPSTGSDMLSTDGFGIPDLGTQTDNISSPARTSRGSASIASARTRTAPALARSAAVATASVSTTSTAGSYEAAWATWRAAHPHAELDLEAEYARAYYDDEDVGSAGYYGPDGQVYFYPTGEGQGGPAHGYDCVCRQCVVPETAHASYADDGSDRLIPNLPLYELHEPPAVVALRDALSSVSSRHGQQVRALSGGPRSARAPTGTGTSIRASVGRFAGVMPGEYLPGWSDGGWDGESQSQTDSCPSYSSRCSDSESGDLLPPPSAQMSAVSGRSHSPSFSDTAVASILANLGLGPPSPTASTASRSTAASYDSTLSASSTVSSASIATLQRTCVDPRFSQPIPYEHSVWASTPMAAIATPGYTPDLADSTGASASRSRSELLATPTPSRIVHAAQPSSLVPDTSRILTPTPSRPGTHVAERQQAPPQRAVRASRPAPTYRTLPAAITSVPAAPLPFRPASPAPTYRTVPPPEHTRVPASNAARPRSPAPSYRTRDNNRVNGSEAATSCSATPTSREARAAGADAAQSRRSTQIRMSGTSRLAGAAQGIGIARTGGPTTARQDPVYNRAGPMAATQSPQHVGQRNPAGLSTSVSTIDDAVHRTSGTTSGDGRSGQVLSRAQADAQRWRTEMARQEQPVCRPSQPVSDVSRPRQWPERRSPVTVYPTTHTATSSITASRTNAATRPASATRSFTPRHVSRDLIIDGNRFELDPGLYPVEAGELVGGPRDIRRDSSAVPLSHSHGHIRSIQPQPDGARIAGPPAHSTRTAGTARIQDGIPSRANGSRLVQHAERCSEGVYPFAARTGAPTPSTEPAMFLWALDRRLMTITERDHSVRASQDGGSSAKDWKMLAWEPGCRVHIARVLDTDWTDDVERKRPAGARCGRQARPNRHLRAPIAKSEATGLKWVYRSDM